jgi:hypothetical protein
VAIGTSALAVNTASNHTAVGSGALAGNTTGVENTAVGYQALGGVTGGSDNTAIGKNAMSNLTTGSNCSGLGYNAQPSAVNVNNEITLGNTGVAALRCQVALTVISDRRDKTNIQDFDIGIELLRDIKRRRFDWAMRDGTVRPKNAIGYIAQELQEAVAKHTGAEHLNLVYASNIDRLEATPANLLPVLHNAILQLDARLQKIEADKGDLR